MAFLLSSAAVLFGLVFLVTFGFDRPTGVQTLQEAARAPRYQPRPGRESRSEKGEEMKNILESISDTVGDIVQHEDRTPRRVYLGSEQLRDLQRLNRGQGSRGHHACEHCGLYPRAKVFDLDIYLVDAKSHLQVV